ncbi:MAG: hypothetical protein AAF633_26440 [Chloroflexota bacterium]
MSEDNFFLRQITNVISSADTDAAAKTVDALRTEKPEATTEEIVDLLIRRKCMQTGSVGAVTSGAAIIPGIGTISAITFGVAADIGMTFKLQAELTLEIAYAYERELTENEKRQIILGITGMSAGFNTGLQKAGQQIATKATAQLAQRSVVKAIPFIGVAASAGTNMATTYLIGQRAKAYFSQNPEAVDGWGETVRTLSGVDERKLVSWMGETTENSWQLISGSTHAMTDTVLVTGRSTGKALLVYTQKSKESIATGSSNMVSAVSNGLSSLWPFGSSADKSEEPTAADELVEVAAAAPEESPSESEKGFFGRLTALFQRDNDDRSEEDTNAEQLFEHSKIVEQVTNSTLENQTVIGMVGASDELGSEAEIDAPQSYFQRAWGLFSWGSNQDMGTQTAPAELINEITHPEQPTALLVVDESEDSSHDEQSGMVSRMFNIFGRTASEDETASEKAPLVVEEIEAQEPFYRRVSNLFRLGKRSE